MYRKNLKSMNDLREFLKEKERKKKEQEELEKNEQIVDDIELSDIDLSYIDLSDIELSDDEVDVSYYNDGHFDLYITKSRLQDAGLGVYTDDFIPENTIIGEYTGEIVEAYNLETNDYYYELVEPDEANGIMGIGIDSSKLPRCYMAMINDAQFSKKYSNNCIFDGDVEQKKVYVVSSRDIEPDEELFISYGEGYWATVECQI
jgi:hypothetical protein